jgi:hypothetical protein
VILGRSGVPSATSMAEALMVGCWSSTPRGSQVVRPRLSSGSQGPDLRAGQEYSSVLCSGLGGDAWSPPAMSGIGALGLDCFSFFLVRVLFAKWRASSSNFRFL